MKQTLLEQLAHHVAVVHARVAMIQGEGFENFEQCSPELRQLYLSGIASDLREARVLLDKAWEDLLAGARSNLHRGVALGLYDTLARDLIILRTQVDFMSLGAGWEAFQKFDDAGDLIWGVATSTGQLLVDVEKFARECQCRGLEPVPQAA